MSDTVDLKLFDKRTVDRHLRSGQLDEKGLEKYIKNLPDLAEQAVAVDTTMSDEGEQPLEDESEAEA